MNSSPWKSWKIPSKLVGNFPACYVSFRGGSGFPTFRVEPPWFMDGFPGLDPIGLDPPILREFSFLSINDSKCLIWELSGSCDFRVWVWCGRFSGYHVFLLYTDGRPSISIMVLLAPVDPRQKWEMNSLESGDFRRRRYLKVWQPQKLDKLIEGWAWPVCMSDILGPGFYFCSDLVDDVHLSVMSIGIVAFVMVLVFLACFISSFISSSSPHWIWGTQICRALCNVYPVVQWPSVSLLLWAFERDTWKKHKKYIYIYSQIYWQLGVLQIASGCYNNIWTLDSQSEAAFVVPQCVFFFRWLLSGSPKRRVKSGERTGKFSWRLAKTKTPSAKIGDHRLGSFEFSKTRMECKVRLTYLYDLRISSLGLKHKVMWSLQGVVCFRCVRKKQAEVLLQWVPGRISPDMTGQMVAIEQKNTRNVLLGGHV